MSRMRRRWLIPLLTVAAGALMIFVGSLARGDYAPQVWVQLGSTVVLFGPLYWLQWIFERGVTEVRQEAQETRSSVQQLSHEIEAIRQQAVSSLDDLRDVALENVQQRRQTDEDAFRRFKDEPTFNSITGLIHRAWELGAISDRGVRVRLPGTTLRLRFPLPGRPDNGSSPVLGVGLEEEDATLPHDATAPDAVVRGQLPVQWSPAQSAGDWAASLAPQLQRLNRYPGDEQFDPAGALEQLMRLLRLAIEARTRPSASPSAPRLKPVIEMPNDEWVITEDGLQSLSSETAFTVRELFDATSAEKALSHLETKDAAKLGEAWRVAQRLNLSPGSRTQR
jgi:regulator of replication initiation timing